MPDNGFRYGQGTRPQTPFKGIIAGNYGTEAARDNVNRYEYQKDLQKTQTNNLSSIRMTHAQIGMDQSVHKRWIEDKPEPSNWQLKRFTAVQPRTSTKRGDE